MAAQSSGSLPSSEGLVKVSCELQLLMSKFKLKAKSETDTLKISKQAEIDDVLF